MRRFQEEIQADRFRHSRNDPVLLTNGAVTLAVQPSGKLCDGIEEDQ